MNDELKSKNLEDYLIADKDAKMELLKSSLEDYRDIIHKKLSGNVTADLEEFCKMNSIGCYGLIFTMINTYNRIDSLIKTQNEIKVMLEYKSLSNKTKMISDADINRRAFQKLLLYYYEIRNGYIFTVDRLIISNCKELYIFSRREFEKLVKIRKMASLLSQ